MDIIICPDSFKNSLSAIEVSKAIECGIKRVNKDHKTMKLPLGDGGEGSLDVLINNGKGNYETVLVNDPLLRKIEAYYGIINNTAVIEMARAAGLGLLAPEERNPMLTTTYGVGELIKHALDQGVREFIIAIGGSATNDCGVGVAKALGVKFLDDNGKSIKATGEGLASLHKIIYKNIDKRILSSKIKILCDVNNPLYGKNGAAYIYAKQKGATDEMVKTLDNNLRHFAKIAETTFEENISKMPGAGAAGGLGAGLMLFLKGELVSGFDTISEMLELERYIKSSDLIITGEGQIDSQSFNGKVAIEVSKIGKKYNKPVIGIVGSYKGRLKDFHTQGMTSIFSIIHNPLTIEEAIDKDYSTESLRNLSEDIMRLIDDTRNI